MRSLIISLLLVSCSHDTAPPAPTPTRQSPPAAAQAKTLEPARNLSGLAVRLQYEATHRPATTPSSERVLDAIDAAGLKVAVRRQFLGVAMKASYCAGGTTSDGIAISVCEYASAAEATAGKKYADRQYAAMGPEAIRATRGATVLTVVRPPERSPELAERALRAFTTL
jgi:hypothetical protein